ncbi:MAG: repeat containing protein [Cyanobacteria bacterium RYN_339]|nr:repeat containing protein [Cyanobacteria bacterium RYN_339]
MTPMARPSSQVVAVGLLLALTGACTGKAPAAATPTKRPVAASARPSTPPVIATTGAGIISDNGGGVISNNGASLTGKVKAAAGIISDNAAGLTSKVKRRLLAVAENPVAGVVVTLETAAGQPVLDAKGQPYTSTTGADGSYGFDFKGNTGNLVVRASLGAKGDLVAFTPKDATGEKRTIDVDTVSTLVLGYILDQYVKGDPKILDKLPADVEADTRAKAASALVAVPDALTPARIVAAVEDLRKANPAFDAQMEVVKKLLVAGLTNQGLGQAVTDVEVNVVSVAQDPITGELLFADANSQRIFKKDAAGHLAAVAGNGDFGSIDRDGVKDGIPATSSPLYPIAMAVDPQGTLYVADLTSATVRQIDRSGTIRTLARLEGQTNIRDLEVAPDGSLWLATNSAIYQIGKDGKVTLISGRFTPYEPFVGTSQRPVDTSPTTPAKARYTDIQAIGVDAKTGDVLIFDAPGILRKLTKDQVTTVAGRLAKQGETTPYGGDGGPALQALFAYVGDMVVDPEGAIIVSDGANNRLRRIKDGTVTTLCGDGKLGIAGDGGPIASAQIAGTTKLRYAPDGALLICGDGMIRRIQDGVITTPVGETRPRLGKQPADKVQLTIPGQLIYEPATNSLIIQEVRHILRWTLDDNMIETIAGHGAAGAPFVQNAPALDPYFFNISGLWKRPDGRIGFATTTSDTQTGAFELKDGHLTRFASGRDRAAFEEPGSPSAGLNVAPDAQAALLGDTLYLAGKKDGVVIALRPDGTAKVVGGIGGETEPVVAADGTTDAMETFFEGAAALAAGPDGLLYVGGLGFITRLDPVTRRAKVFAGNGDLAAPTSGSRAATSSCSLVSGITWDVAGNMVYAAGANGMVMRIDKATGIQTQLAGKGGPNLAGPGIDDALSYPIGLAFDKSGNLFIADTVYHQIKMIPAAKLK